jgi:hypothetical protein
MRPDEATCIIVSGSTRKRRVMLRPLSNKLAALTSEEGGTGKAAASLLRYRDGCMSELEPIAVEAGRRRANTYTVPVAATPRSGTGLADPMHARALGRMDAWTQQHLYRTSEPET